MSESRKYNTDALFYFPLIAAGAVDFETSITPAAGDCKLFSDTQIFTNTVAKILGFDSMSEIPAVGDTITEATGDGSGVVMAVVVVSGTVGTTGAGFMFLRSVLGTWTNDIDINITSGTSNVATVDSTTYDLAATAGLFGVIGNGLCAIALTPTEVSCGLGEIHIIDSATKVWEDQAVQFTTFGNASALVAMDFDTTVPTAAANVDEWEAQSQAAPTGFHVNVKEVNGTAQTSGDVVNVVAAILVDTMTTLQAELDAIQVAVITDAAGDNVAKDIIALKTAADAIKTVTDKFAFTVPNKVDSNTKSVNDITVTGAGTAGDPFGP